MKIRVVAYGIAREIIDNHSIEIELGESPTISELKQNLVESFPAFSELASLKFAVNEEYQPDSFLLADSDEVVIIPPVSGG